MDNDKRQEKINKINEIIKRLDSKSLLIIETGAQMLFAKQLLDEEKINKELLTLDDEL